MRRLRECLHDWLYASNQDPEWPIRCASSGCDAPAYTSQQRHDGSVVFRCDDCAAHVEAFWNLNNDKRKEQQHDL